MDVSDSPPGDRHPSCNPSCQPQCYKPKSVNPKKPIDGSMHFSIMKHYKAGYEAMNVLRHSGQLCDVTLRVGSEHFRAHRVVLAAASPYFRGMFCTRMRESDMTNIPIEGVKPSVMSSLIEFAYTSEIHVSEMNVCSLLPAATMFQMTDVIEACCTFLEQQLDANNCIGIGDFAQMHGCSDLYVKARSFTYENFSDVSQHEEYLTLSAPQVKQVIKRDELNVRCESEVYGAIIRWVRSDMKTRAVKLEDLLCGVRCHFLTPNFLQHQLKYCDVLQAMPTCKAYLQRVLQDLMQHRRCPDKRRKPNAPPVIYTIGGYLRHSLDNVECFNPKTQEWFKLADLPMPRSGVVAIVVHGLLYVLGGRNNSARGNEDTGSVDVYDPFMNLWRKCTQMSAPRNRVGVGSIDGLVYAVGGSHQGTHHNSVERYAP